MAYLDDLGKVPNPVASALRLIVILRSSHTVPGQIVGCRQDWDTVARGQTKARPSPREQTKEMHNSRACQLHPDVIHLGVFQTGNSANDGICWIRSWQMSKETGNWRIQSEIF